MMTKDFPQNQPKEAPRRKPPEEWPDMMLTDTAGFSLRYLIPRRWRRPAEPHEMRLKQRR